MYQPLGMGRGQSGQQSGGQEQHGLLRQWAVLLHHGGQRKTRHVWPGDPGRPGNRIGRHDLGGEWARPRRFAVDCEDQSAAQPFGVGAFKGDDLYRKSPARGRRLGDPGHSFVEHPL
ncbi:hypothetical protein [Nonomuraea basaltis]|uniref:hypothetical protein n=1 Tax=Nonomuraea basaltis TaxID=2495887 RepID=UPI0014874902|nr:hypothetical protein [Nonomuraea basaltis]